MKYKKSIIVLLLAIFLFSITTVCASEIDTPIASEDTNQIELSVNDEMSMDNRQTSEEKLELGVDDESLSEKTDTDILDDSPATYSDLAVEINNPGNVILTHKNYTYDDGAGAIEINEENKVIDGNGAVIDMAGSAIRAFTVSSSGVTIKNLTIKNANFSGTGGAVFFKLSGTVLNCNFTNNSASNGGAIRTNTMGYGKLIGCSFTDNSALNGGAVNMYAGTIEKCSFTGNTATNVGGAVVISEGGSLTDCSFTGNTALEGGALNIYTGNIENCNFTGNNATKGSAIKLNGGSDTIISHSLFLNNRADASADDPLNVTVKGNTIEITFMGQNNLLNAIRSNNGINFTDVTYWGSEGISNTGADSIILSPLNYEAGQSISVIGVVNGNIIKTCKPTDENGKIILENMSNYYLVIRHDTDSYYTEAEKTIANMKCYVNITSQTTNDRTVNITAKSNIYSEVMPGGLMFCLPKMNVTAEYAGNGTWWTAYIFRDYATYEITGFYVGLDNVTVGNATITVNKVNTILTADAVTATYNINRDLVITLKDANGNALSGAKLTVDLNGAREYVTDANGQVKVSTAGLAPKTYTAKITFAGNENCLGSSANVNVIIKKAALKIIAKKKTFKKSKKVKKYTVTLKNNVGKAMKKVKLTLKVKGKTYKAKTNAKGKAVFKIKNLKKKGKYTAKVTFNGNKHYKKASKKVKITIK